MGTLTNLATKRQTTPDWGAIAAALAQRFAERAAGHDGADSFVAENVRDLRTAKLFSAGVPTELGGGGAEYAELADILRILARGCGATALAFAMHTHGVAMNVWRLRHDKAPVEPLLRRVAAEELILVSSGGSDWLASGGRAERVEGGYRISATKRFASGSPVGDVLMTGAVLDDPEAGPTVLHFGLSLQAPAVTVVDNWRALGMRGSGSGDVVIDGAFVAEAAVGVRRPLGRWHHLFHVITMVALPLIYAVYTGLAEAAREVALDHARRRSADPHLPTAVGRMETELLAAQLALRQMLELGAEAVPGAATTSRVLAARTLTARACLATVDAAMAVVGGAAMRRDLPLERIFRDIQGARFHPVAEQPQLCLTGRHALGLPLDA